MLKCVVILLILAKLSSKKLANMFPIDRQTSSLTSAADIESYRMLNAVLNWPTPANTTKPAFCLAGNLAASADRNHSKFVDEPVLWKRKAAL